MKANRILLLVVFAVTCLFNSEAYAHWYMGGFFGTQFNANGNTQIPSIASKPPLTSEPVYERGYALSANLGYKFYSSFRVEGEFAYQNLPMNKINDAVGIGIVTNVNNSYTRLFSAFVNGYYDFSVGQHWIPYIGFGLGYVDVKNTIRPNPPIPVGFNLFFTKKEINYDAVGYQGILGLGYQPTPYVVLSVNYKYFSTFETKATGETNLGPDGYKTKQTVKSNVILFGVEYFFI